MQGHENHYNTLFHLELNKSTRPSDYAARFYIRATLSDVGMIFDLGGNVGKLFTVIQNI